MDYKIDNIVIIGDRNKREIYAYSILVRMQPSIYDEFGCIKIQVKSSLLNFADNLLRKWKFAGLKEISRKKKPIKSDRGYTIPDAWEIVLEKMGAVALIEDEE